MTGTDADGLGRAREKRRKGRGRERERTDGSRGKKKSINLAPRNVAARGDRRRKNETHWRHERRRGNGVFHIHSDSYTV